MSQGANPDMKDAVRAWQRFQTSSCSDFDIQAGRIPAQVTKSLETKAFFAEASQNPSVYQRVPAGSSPGPDFSASNAPFVDAADDADEEPVNKNQGNIFQ